MYWTERLALSEGMSAVMSPLKIQYLIHASTNVDAIQAAEILPNPSIAAMSAVIKQRGLPEDNSIVAGDRQSGPRAY